jgi:S-adenosyl-L-methionine hydrolase (adenosine-forming)
MLPHFNSTRISFRRIFQAFLRIVRPGSHRFPAAAGSLPPTRFHCYDGAEKSMTSPTHNWISLTTDFGLDDPFVGTMKGVIAGICPDARVIDLTHGVRAFSVLEGAIKLWQGARFFPAGTIHVAVVDPGVGSDRRPLLTRAGNYFYVAPDNGLLTWILEDAEAAQKSVSVRALTNEQYFLPGDSRTFHGRDIFAPVAANLAAGVAEEEFGPLIHQHGRAVKGEAPLVKLEHTRAVSKVFNDENRVEMQGVVLLTDRFGNLLTNIRREDWPLHLTSNFSLQVADRKITTLCRHFAEGKPGELIAIFGSSGLLEIVVNRGSAAELLGVSLGAVVIMRG